MNEASYYPLAHRDPRFIHQHLVDACGAQHVRDSASTIPAAFTLAGLYLAIEGAFTGRQVQRKHMLMAQRSKQWPRFHPPTDAGSLAVADMLAADPGQMRDEALMAWCASVWRACERDHHDRVRAMVDAFLTWLTSTGWDSPRDGCLGFLRPRAG